MIEDLATPISATEARVHFGKVLPRVARGETLGVERGGKGVAFIRSLEEYEQLRKAPKPQEIRDALWNLGQGVRSHVQGPIPSPEEAVRAMREERSLELGGP